MRIFIARLIRPLVACIVAGAVFAVLTQPWSSAYYHFIGMQTNWGSTFDRTSEWSDLNKQDISVIFFGSSTCYSSIDPSFCSEYGESGFSFCSPGSNVGNSLHILTNILDSLPNLKTVVLDVYPANWSNSFVTIESTRDFIINNASTDSDLTWAGRDMAFGTKDPYTIVLSFLLPWLKQIGILNHHAPVDDKGVYRGRGFVYRTTPSLGEAPNCATTSSTLRVFPYCDQFDEFQSICRDKGVKLILVKPPELCHHEYELPACWNNIPFINGDLWPQSKNYRYFRDDHHMVGLGADQYTSWLGKQLSEIW